jgi:carboxyl-terminal processing protease
MKFKKRSFLLIVFFSIALGLAFPKINYAVDNTYQQLKILIDIMDLINKNYVEDVDYKKLLHGAARGMVDQLDDFSQFLDSDAYESVKRDTEGEFGGIGIRLEILEGWPTVVTPMPNTPAYKAGIYPGDKIIKIEGENTKGMFSYEVVKRLTGKPGTKVKITIAREPLNKDDDWITKDIELKRDIIKVDALKYKILNENIGYIKINDFSAHLIEDFDKAMKEMTSKKINSLIIDLRYNPGGLLMGAVDLSKFFLDSQKMIVYTKGKNNSNYTEFKADKNCPYPNIPLVILINRYSASASEIFTGAMQDNKRAIIIGENSFGKASVQQLLPLSDGSALRLTIAHYYTPNGRMIHRDMKTGEGGIMPDIEIKVKKEDELKLLENINMEEIYYPETTEKSKEKPQVKKKEKAKTENVKDEVLFRAIEILKAKDIFSRLNPKNV